jgi:hypothetical protein
MKGKRNGKKSQTRVRDRRTVSVWTWKPEHREIRYALTPEGEEILALLTRCSLP